MMIRKEKSQHTSIDAKSQIGREKTDLERLKLAFPPFVLLNDG